MTAIARRRQSFAMLRALLAALSLGFAAATPASAASPAPSGWVAAIPSVPRLPDLGDLTVQNSAGIALHGFDPVAYFAEGRAVSGKERHEWLHEGVVWRFANAANRDAFRFNPYAYMPAFGGYDAVAVARGTAVETRPDQFIIEGGRLLLFRDRAAREKFAASPQILAQAYELWPTIKRELAR
jgi:hypothetical protein